MTNTEIMGTTERIADDFPKDSLKRERSSNLELFRIVVMLLIIAHHYVVNSGLFSVDGPIYSNPLALKSIFLILFGMWGKTGINCFVLITGYFMCKRQITLKKFLKLVLEFEFYKILIYAIFLITGYQSFDFVTFAKLFFPVTSIEKNFTGCYLIFFLFIPFLNILIANMTQKQHLHLVALSCFVYVIISAIPKFDVAMNYLTWYIVLYIIASYIRLYPNKWLENTKVMGLATVFFVFISISSVLCLDWITVKLHWFSYGRVYYFVMDSNAILAILTAISAFCFFKNLKIRNSKLINTIAASTFGVLCIHANSAAMRQWLWRDTLNNVGMYDSNLIYLHSIASVIGVFIVCTLIDIVRIRFIEEPFFRWYDKKAKKHA